jgi:hypothetical protein
MPRVAVDDEAGQDGERQQEQQQRQPAQEQAEFDGFRVQSPATPVQVSLLRNECRNCFRER